MFGNLELFRFRNKLSFRQLLEVQTLEYSKVDDTHDSGPLYNLAELVYINKCFNTTCLSIYSIIVIFF